MITVKHHSEVQGPGRYVLLGEIEPLIEQVDKPQVYDSKGRIDTVVYGPRASKTIVHSWDSMLDGVKAPESVTEADSLLARWFSLLGVEPSTLGGVGRSLAQSVAIDVWKPTKSRVGDAVYHARLGPRVEVFHTEGVGSLEHWDIPACYATLGLDLVPVGAPARTYSTKPHPCELWLAKVRSTRRLDPGPLPVRMEHGQAFPSEGEWTGYYYLPEIELALTLGWEVEPIERWYFPAAKQLAPLMEKLLKYRELEEFGTSPKLLANRIIGCLSSKGSGLRTVKRAKPQVGWVPVQPDLGIWKVPSKPRLPPYGRPQLASWVWSRARVQLYQGLVASPETVYAHTDGLWTCSPSRDPPPGWKLKRTVPFQRWWCPRPGALATETEVLRESGQPEHWDRPNLRHRITTERGITHGTYYTNNDCPVHPIHRRNPR